VEAVCQRLAPDDQDEISLVAVLYNATTVLTITVGVVCLYIGLFAIILVGESFLIDRRLFEEDGPAPGRLDRKEQGADEEARPGD
jgi:hypothetical protein